MGTYGTYIYYIKNSANDSCTVWKPNQEKPKHTPNTQTQEYDDSVTQNSVNYFFS